MSSIRPAALAHGDTIAFISPSSRLNHLFPLRVQRAVEALGVLGFKVIQIYNDKLPSSHVASLKARCQEIHSAFAEPSVKAIITTIGGESANELLPHLDYDLIRRNPKILCGYSDITVLHQAIFAKTGLATFYGPAAIPQFGAKPCPDYFTIESMLQMLGSTSPAGPLPQSSAWTDEFLDWANESKATRPRKTVPNAGWKWLRSGQCKGRIQGGCLPTLLQLAGTEYQPDYRGKILMFELPEFQAPDAPTPVAAARTMVADLRLHGILQVIVGLIVGRPYRYTEAMNALFKQMVIDQCYDTTFPILTDVDVGHTDPILTIPLEVMASLDSQKNEFSIIEAAVSK